MIKARLKWHLAKYFNFSSPAHIDLELSTKCKLNCEFCFRKEHKYPKKDMPVDMVLSLLWQAKENNIPSVKFNWRGEVLEHPHCFDIFQLASEYGFYTMLNTALAGDYNDIQLQYLARYIDNLKVSFDSSAEKIYNRIRKGADFFQTLANLDKLIALRKEYKMPKIILNRRTTKISEPDEAFREFFGDEVEYDIRPAMVRNKSNIYTWENIHYDLQGEINSIRKYCNQPNRRMVIDVDGDCYPCCVCYAGSNDLLLGNIKDNTLSEIWNFNKRKALMKTLKHGNYENDPCKNCSSGESYK